MLLAVPTRAAPDEHVSIVLSDARGPAMHRASGFLGSISEDRPPDEVVRAVKPRLFRLDTVRTRNMYGRVVALGATAQLVPSYPEFDGPPRRGRADEWMATWERHLQALVAETVARKETWQWDIWNEPNWPKFWRGTREQFFDTWRRSHRIIRAKIPDAVIVGPSLAYYDASYLQAFLLYAREHDVLPDVLSWHELQPRSPASIVERVNEMRAFLAEHKMGISRIQLNEIVAPTHQYKPGALVWFQAAVERAGVDAAAKSCWIDGFNHNCINDSLNGLLGAGGRNPRSAYWTYKAYADITGELVTVEPSQRFDGVAGRDAGTLRAIIGNHDRGRHSLSVTVTGVSTIERQQNTQHVRVRAFQIPNTERRALDGPILLFEREVPVENDAVRLDFPRVDGWSAIVLEMREPEKPAKGLCP
jgi:xylan 1,4-beta-xylosidase